MPPEYNQVSTATPTRHDADRIAKAVVERKLAACAQVIGPIASTYWWKGKIEVAQEWLCIIKTRRGRYRQLETAIKELHPYETPEIVAVPIVSGSKEYLSWIGATTR
jgi:periplasmic divalent cation tolerance protein